MWANTRTGAPGMMTTMLGCKVPVALKDLKQVSADSLQSPHDPDVTYSGHKGKGYEVQVAETCHEENATQLISRGGDPLEWERHRQRAGR